MTEPTEATRPVPRLRLHQKALLVAEALLLYPRVRYLVTAKDLKGALAGIRRSRRPMFVSAGGYGPLITGYRLSGAVRGTLGLIPFDGRCLMRSLVLSGMLAKRGIETRLVIGVLPERAPAGGLPLDAHAWIELDGMPLLPVRGPHGRLYGRLVEL